MARGFRLALALPEVRYDCFFISAADGLNTRPTLELVRERYGFLPEIRRPELYERLPTASVLDGSRARDVLGFAPTSDWRQMLACLHRRSLSRSDPMAFAINTYSYTGSHAGAGLHPASRRAGLRRLRADDVSGPSVARRDRRGGAPRAARPGRVPSGCGS